MPVEFYEFLGWYAYSSILTASQSLALNLDDEEGKGCVIHESLTAPRLDQTLAPVLLLTCHPNRATHQSILYM